MPGTVVSVQVRNREMVTEGQLLLVYESMKMENEVLAPVSGKTQNINVKEGDKIEIGQNLITYIGD